MFALVGGGDMPSCPGRSRSGNAFESAKRRHAHADLIPEAISETQQTTNGNE
jgi:hypothetical protein